MNHNEFIQELREKRLSYGLSQNALATKANITRQYLNKIETGKAIPSQKLQDTILLELERFNPENPLDLMIDYVRIRFPTMDIEHVLEDIIRIKMKFMDIQDYAFYGYTQQYVIGDIVVMTSLNENMGILLELKGKGCRQYESYLHAQDRDWIHFFKNITSEGGLFKRLDLAINDRYGILNIPQLIEKCENEECISLFRTFKNYRSGELVRAEEKDKATMGNTLYLGSQKSEIYFCIYEKAYEQYIKNNIPIEDAEIKNRFEIRLKNERATNAIEDLLSHEDIEKTVSGIINNYMRFVDREDEKDRRNWKINKEWEWFIGTDLRQLKLTTKPEPYTLDKTLRWMEKQVAPSLKMVLELDKINDAKTVESIIKHARLSPRHQKIIEQQRTNITEIISK